VQPCNAGGQVKPGTKPIEATAQLVTGPEVDVIWGKVVAEYGVMTKITKLL